LHVCRVRSLLHDRALCYNRVGPYDLALYQDSKQLDTRSPAVATVIKMIEHLPEPTQDQVVEHLRRYIAQLQDELDWDRAFDETQAQLIAAARRARQEIAAGYAEAMGHDRL
jgi:hypothetical protein